jgi:hypothetical protein
MYLYVYVYVQGTPVGISKMSNEGTGVKHTVGRGRDTEESGRRVSIQVTPPLTPEMSMSQPDSPPLIPTRRVSFLATPVHNNEEESPIHTYEGIHVYIHIYAYIHIRD